MVPCEGHRRLNKRKGGVLEPVRCKDPLHVPRVQLPLKGLRKRTDDKNGFALENIHPGRSLIQEIEGFEGLCLNGGPLGQTDESVLGFPAPTIPPDRQECRVLKASERRHNILSDIGVRGHIDPCVIDQLMDMKRLNLLLEFFGAAHVNRTRDPIITNDVLYQLS